MSIDLKSKTTRRQLEARREPYWQRFTAGFHIGFRVIDSGKGTWIARQQTEDGKQKYQALKEVDPDFNDEDFDAAVKVANAWLRQRDMRVTKSDTTVTDACKDYVTRQKTEKGAASARDAEIRFERLLYGKPIGKIHFRN